MPSILLCGAVGQMGRMTQKALNATDDCTLVALCDRDDDLDALLQTHAPDIAIDFTTPEAGFGNAMRMIEAGVHPVIGTTGLTDAQLNTLQSECDARALGGLVVPNFSIGTCLMMQAATLAAPYFSHIEITETHHTQKRDAPSGTALRLAKEISTHRTTHGQDATEVDTIPHARGALHHDIPIHAKRLPSAIAEHAVSMSNVGELFSIEHKALSRDIYAPGILLACRQVMSLKTLHIGLTTLLPFATETP